MSRASLVEAQFANYSPQPEYGSAEKGVLLFDMDAKVPITPESVGLSADLGSINDFMVSHGATREHLNYTTIGLFSPGSSDATIPGTTIERGGFVGEDLHITGDVGLRFPVIALRHDSRNPDVNRLNFSLRHEIRHLLGANRTAPYNNERLTARLRAASATIGSLATPLAVAMWAPSVAADALHAGITVGEYTDTLVSGSIGALAAIAMTYGLIAHPRQVMRKLAPGEYSADHFSRKNRHFQPFSQT
jgi:hypothetical protein